MAYRDILVGMDGGPAARARAGFAADMAAKFDATLIGAYPRSQVPDPFLPPDLMALMTPAEIERIADEHARMVESLADQSRRSFEAAAAAADVDSDWLVLKDADEMIACARRSDLMVLSAKDGQIGPLTPAALAVASGGPALILPPAATPSTFRRVLVAWNGSREAARALRAAWPLVSLADDVDVLIVSRGGLHGPEGLLQRHFERHGVGANVILDDSEDAAAAKILRRQMETRAPDLLVMGLYGRTRIRELILGGASREMLAEPTVPLFVCH